MIRRLLALPALALVVLVLTAAGAGAHVELAPGEAVAGSTTTTTKVEATTTIADAGDDLPGTTLDAAQRDDGTTVAAPWLIGSGLAAAAAIGVGGLLLKRRAG